jgi:hypothetical protein
MDQKPRTKRRRNLQPGRARTRSQQVKVSEYDREIIVALARLNGMTPSTWCYHAIMAAVATQQDRLRNPSLRLVPAPETETETENEVETYARASEAAPRVAPAVSEA